MMEIQLDCLIHWMKLNIKLLWIVAGLKEEYHEKFAFVKSQCNKYGGDVFSKTTRPSLYFFEQVELDEQGNIVSINGNPIDEIVQEILDGSDDVNDNFIAIKQKVSEYYTM